MPANQNEVPRTAQPRVAVIIPTHNYKAFVRKAIHSAVGQDYDGDVHIYVVDDGSTDDTFEYLKSACTCTIESGVVKLFRQDEAKGPSSARNIGIREAWDKSDVFMFLDADDKWEPSKISKSLNKWLEDPDNIGVVYTDNININIETGTRIREFREPYSRSRLMQHNMIHSGSLVSKKAFEMVGGYDEEMRVAEDLDLWIRISEQLMIAHVPEPLVLSTVHNNNSTSTVSQETWKRNWKRIQIKMHERQNANTN